MSKAYEILLTKNVFEGDGEQEGEINYAWTSPEGRMFNIRDLAGRYSDPNKRYLLEELVPGELSPNVRNTASDTLKADYNAYRQSAKPNLFYGNLPDPLTPDDLCYCGGGIGVDTVFYATLGDTKKAIHSAIEANEWYVDGCEAAQSTMDEVAAAKANLRERIAYWQGILRGLERGEPGIPEMFKGLGNLWGPLATDGQNRLLAFFNKPDARTWGEIASMILLAGKTAWQIWVDYDFEAPRGKPHGSEWKTWPAPKDFLRYLKEARGDIAYSTRRKIRAAEEELSQL